MHQKYSRSKGWAGGSNNVGGVTVYHPYMLENLLVWEAGKDTYYLDFTRNG